MAPAVSCREGAKRSADSNKSPSDSLPKRQDSPCGNRANWRGTGSGRKYANLTCPRECRMKAECRFLRHFAARHGTPCGRNPSPASAPRGERLAKGQTGFCTRTDSIQSGKSLPKPLFSLPSVPAGTALRQKSFVFAEGSSFLCGKRFCFYLEKTPAEMEKCSIQTVSSPVFNSPAPACSRPSCH